MAARPHPGRQVVDGGLGAGADVEEDQPDHHHVLRPRGEAGGVGASLDHLGVAQPRGRDLLRGGGARLGSGLHPDRRPGVVDQPRQLDEHRARAAADVGDPRPRHHPVPPPPVALLPQRPLRHEAEAAALGRAEVEGVAGAAVAGIGDHRAGLRSAGARVFGPLDAERPDGGVVLEDDDLVEALPPELRDRPAQQPLLMTDDVGADAALAARPVALLAHRLGEVEDERHRRPAVLAGEPHHGAARGGVQVGGVDHGEEPAAQAGVADRVHHREGVLVGVARDLVARDQGPAAVGGDHLGVAEVAPGEGGLPRPRGADQHHQAGIGETEAHPHVSERRSWSTSRA